MELHGGRIWLESELGRGQHLRLPAAPARRSAGARRTRWSEPRRGRAPADRRHRGRRELRRAGRRARRAAGMRAVAVRTGEEGLAAVAALHPAAVILDIRLPGHGRLGRARRAQGRPETAGHAGGGRLGAARARPWLRPRRADYLVKPVAGGPARRACGAPSPSRVDRSSDAATSSSSTTTPWPSSWSGHPRAARLGRPHLHRGRGGARAWSALCTPSVVLVDLLMPDPDGFAVVDALRADPRTAPSPSSC